MRILAFETSCDETSAAVIVDGGVRSNVVSSQIALHAPFGGVVPELATREHLRNFPVVAEQALREAGLQSRELDAIAATRGPGLPSALMVGCKAGQALAFSLRIPFFGVHHHEAHLYSPWITGMPPRGDFDAFQPNVSLIVSGGHTLLVRVSARLEHHLLGSTIDDAAGECFDKAAKLIGLPYPGGPELDRLSQGGDPRRFDFPRPLLREDNDDFSFSGLKTSVRYFLRDHPEHLENNQSLRDLCASVQAAIVEVLVTKTIRATLRLQLSCVTASGGVTCNRALRGELTAACAQAGLTLRLADKSFCTDNAAMIGILAEQQLLAGHPPTPVDAEVNPAWSLSTESARRP